MPRTDPCRIRRRRRAIGDRHRTVMLTAGPFFWPLPLNYGYAVVAGVGQTICLRSLALAAAR